MLLGHLMMGVLCGLAAVAAALTAGQPAWMAVLLYMLVGNACWIASLLLHAPRDRPKRPARAVARPAG